MQQVGRTLRAARCWSEMPGTAQDSNETNELRRSTGGCGLCHFRSRRSGCDGRPPGPVSGPPRSPPGMTIAQCRLRRKPAGAAVQPRHQAAQHQRRRRHRCAAFAGTWPPGAALGTVVGQRGKVAEPALDSSAARPRNDAAGRDRRGRWSTPPVSSRTAPLTAAATPNGQFRWTL